MTADNDSYWFPAKRHGWGWGAPRRWQGWVVVLGYLVLSVLGPLVFRLLPEHVLKFFVYQGVLTAALLVICWRRGAPPRWRSGDDK